MASSAEQLALPEEVVRYFDMRQAIPPCDFRIRDRMGTGTVELLEYRATGRRAPKYKPVHYRDWIKAQTKPWRRPPDIPLSALLSKHKGTEGFAHEFIPESAR